MVSTAGTATAPASANTTFSVAAAAIATKADSHYAAPSRHNNESTTTTRNGGYAHLDIGECYGKTAAAQAGDIAELPKFSSAPAVAASAFRNEYGEEPADPAYRREAGPKTAALHKQQRQQQQQGGAEKSIGIPLRTDQQGRWEHRVMKETSEENNSITAATAGGDENDEEEEWEGLAPDDYTNGCDDDGAENGDGDEGGDDRSELGTAYYDYEAKQEDELSFERGSIIEIIDRNCEAGWVRAKVNDIEGMVPSNYVYLIGSQPNLIEGERLRRLEKIGSGGFSTVYQGLLNEVEDVALKVPFMDPSSSRDGEEKRERVRKACLHEALILSRLQSHPNIVGFHGICLQPVMQLVMERCAGGTVFHLLRKMPGSDVRVALHWCRQVASAMHHLHTRHEPMVHADLKADNVLIKEAPCACCLQDESWMNDEDGMNYDEVTGICRNCRGVKLANLTMKLTDFGLSRTLTDRRDSKLSIEGGSAAWSPPEVIISNHYSEKSDVWSFGVLMWEIFSCRLPYNEYENNIYILYSVAYKQKTPRLPIDCPSALRDLFASCWRQKPEERTDFGQLLVELEQLSPEKRDSKVMLPAELASFKWRNRDEPKFDIERDLREYRDLTEEQTQQLLSGLHCLPTAKPAPANRPIEAMKRAVGGGGGGSGTARAKISKDQIGTPTDFHHSISVTHSPLPQFFPQSSKGGHAALPSKGTKNKRGFRASQPAALFNVIYDQEQHQELSAGSTPKMSTLNCSKNPPPPDPQSSYPYHRFKPRNSTSISGGGSATLGRSTINSSFPNSIDSGNNARRSHDAYSTLLPEFNRNANIYSISGRELGGGLEKEDGASSRKLPKIPICNGHNKGPKQLPQQQRSCHCILPGRLGGPSKSNPELHKIHTQRILDPPRSIAASHIKPKSTCRLPYIGQACCSPPTATELAQAKRPRHGSLLLPSASNSFSEMGVDGEHSGPGEPIRVPLRWEEDRLGGRASPTEIDDEDTELARIRGHSPERSRHNAFRRKLVEPREPPPPPLLLPQHSKSSSLTSTNSHTSSTMTPTMAAFHTNGTNVSYEDEVRRGSIREEGEEEVFVGSIGRCDSYCEASCDCGCAVGKPEEDEDDGGDEQMLVQVPASLYSRHTASTSSSKKGSGCSRGGQHHHSHHHHSSLSGESSSPQQNKNSTQLHLPSSSSSSNSGPSSSSWLSSPLEHLAQRARSKSPLLFGSRGNAGDDSTPATPLAAVANKRDRNSSSSHSHSRFYISSREVGEDVEDGEVDLDSPFVDISPSAVHTTPGSFERRISGSGGSDKRVSGYRQKIFSTITSLLPGSWGPPSSSVRNHTHSGGRGANDGEVEGVGMEDTSKPIVQAAKCCHPHHFSGKEPLIFLPYEHGCFDYSVDFILQRRAHLPNGAPGDPIIPLYAQAPPTNAPKPSVVNQSRFVKRSEAPDRQRQKHRMGTAASTTSANAPISSPPPVMLQTLPAPKSRAANTTTAAVTRSQLPHTSSGTLPSKHRGSILEKSIGMSVPNTHHMELSPPFSSATSTTTPPFNVRSSENEGHLASAIPTTSSDPVVSHHGRSSSANFDSAAAAKHNKYSTMPQQGVEHSASSFCNGSRTSNNHGVFLNRSYVHMKQLQQRQQQQGQKQSREQPEGECNRQKTAQLVGVQPVVPTITANPAGGFHPGYSTPSTNAHNDGRRPAPVVPASTAVAATMGHQSPPPTTSSTISPHGTSSPTPSPNLAPPIPARRTRSPAVAATTGGVGNGPLPPIPLPTGSPSSASSTASISPLDRPVPLPRTSNNSQGTKASVGVASGMPGMKLPAVGMPTSKAPPPPPPMGAMAMSLYEPTNMRAGQTTSSSKVTRPTTLHLNGEIAASATMTTAAKKAVEMKGGKAEGEGMRFNNGSNVAMGPPNPRQPVNKVAPYSHLSAVESPQGHMPQPPSCPPPALPPLPMSLPPTTPPQSTTSSLTPTPSSSASSPNKQQHTVLLPPPPIPGRKEAGGSVCGVDGANFASSNNQQMVKESPGGGGGMPRVPKIPTVLPNGATSHAVRVKGVVRKPPAPSPASKQRH